MGVLPALGSGLEPGPPLSLCPPQVGRLHGSVPNLSRYLEPGQLPFSLPPEYSQLQRSFWLLAQKGGTGEGAPSGVWGSWGGEPCCNPPPCPCPRSARLAQQRGGGADGREGSPGGDAAGAGPAALGPPPGQCWPHWGEGRGLSQGGVRGDPWVPCLGGASAPHRGSLGGGAIP